MFTAHSSYGAKHAPYADHPAPRVADHVEAYNIGPGLEHEILSKFVCGSRAIIFAKLASGTFGIVSASLDRDGSIDRVFGCIRVLKTEKLAELDAAVVQARRAFNESVSR